MTTRSVLLFITTLLMPLTGHSADSEASASNLFNFNGTNCLTFAERNPKPNASNMSQSEILQYAKSQIPDICENLLIGEILKGAAPHKACVNLSDDNPRELLRTYFRNKKFSYEITSAQQNLHDKLISQCLLDLTPDIVVKIGEQGSIAEMYSQALLRDERIADEKKANNEKRLSEEKSLANKRDSEHKLAAAIKSAQEIERNFDLKGLSLKLSRQQVIALTGGKHWKCHNVDGDLSVEVCTLEIARLGCVQMPVTDPRTGGPLINALGNQVMVNQNCGLVTPVININQLPPEGQRLTSVGGQHILNIIIELSEGKPYAFLLTLDRASPDLESGLVEKFGQPITRNSDRLEWFSKDETLEYLPSEARLHVYKSTMLNIVIKRHQEFVAAKKAVAQSELRRKEQVISDTKKKDF